jgi:Zn-dependent protease
MHLRGNFTLPGYHPARMFIQELQNDPRFFLAVCITVVVSICLHELSHGITAIWFGDRTPIESGHMTLNPAVHMGPISLICLLLGGIAWGLMPVDPTRLRGKYADALVALAGPLSNILLAVLAIASLGLWQRFDHRSSTLLGTQLANFRYLLWIFGYVNFNLAIFNFIPIPPLDGARILANFSRSYAHLMEHIRMAGGTVLLFILVFSSAGMLTYPAALKLSVSVLELARGY